MRLRYLGRRYALDPQVVVLDDDHLVAVDRHVGDLVYEEVVSRPGTDQLEGVHVRQGVVVAVETRVVRAACHARHTVLVACDRPDHASAQRLELELPQDVVAVDR